MGYIVYTKESTKHVYRVKNNCLVSHMLPHPCHAQPCPTLCGLVDSSPPGSSVLGDSPGKNTGMGGHALLQGIFPTQGSIPGLPHCRQFFFFFFFTDRATREANVYRVKNNHSASRVHPHPGQDIKPVWKPRSSQRPLLRQSPPFL